MPHASKSSSPLGHLRVLEIASLYAAPYVGRILNDFGAEVLKIEDIRGDQLRTWSPTKNGMGLQFARHNSNKKSASINLRDERGRDLIRRLVPHYDIVVENFRPGRLERWGLGYEDLRAINPDVVMVRISGYGQTGPLKDRPGFATVAESIAGITYSNGWADRPPTSQQFGLGDMVAGLAGAFGAMAAIVKRDREGGGQEVDLAIYEPLLSFFGGAILRYSALGEITERAGNTGGGTSPRGIYECSDGKWVAISGSTQNMAVRIFTVIGRADLLDDPRFATNIARVENNDFVDSLVSEWVKVRTRSQVLQELERAEVACGPVNTAADIVADEHFRDRGSIIEYVSEAMGTVVQTGPLLKLTGYQPDDIHDPPVLGQHTAEVLQEVGVTQDELRTLQDAGVIGMPDANS